MSQWRPVAGDANSVKHKERSLLSSLKLGGLGLYDMLTKSSSYSILSADNFQLCNRLIYKQSQHRMMLKLKTLISTYF